MIFADSEALGAVPTAGGAAQQFEVEARIAGLEQNAGTCRCCVRMPSCSHARI